MALLDEDKASLAGRIACLDTGLAWAEDARQPDEHTVGLCHVALKIEDRIEELRAAKVHLEANGVAVRRIEGHRVSRSIDFADPDGNELELYIDSDPRIWKEDPSAVASVEPFEI